ncbi:hypothetical protein H0H92_006756 [Tricholoma furcatifolium]|nr:hypothetical protein H0H92_006756 [Tricholoma furcatifolium]
MSVAPSSRLYTLIALALGCVVVRGQTCDTYVVPTISGGFTTRQFIDFSTVTAGGDASSLLSSYGISISDYSVSSTPVAHTFTPDNVALGTGSLEMTVSAYTGSGAVISSEIVTNELFEFGSVRTVLQSSTTPGVVEGNFFYLNDNEEIDFEILTSTTLTASADVPAGIWATNQPENPPQAQRSHLASILHKASMWGSNATTFYIDGVQQAQLTTNVPNAAGHWIWNVWSSGDPEWSNGPPTADSVTYIQSIEIYNGYTSTVSGTVCDV